MSGALPAGMGDHDETGPGAQFAATTALLVSLENVLRDIPITEQ